MNGYLFGDIPPRGYAAFRILTGIYLLAYFGAYWPHVTLLFSNEGVYLTHRFADFAPAPWAARVIYGLLLVAVGCFCVGYRTRIATPILLGLVAYHHYLSFAVRDTSYDRLLLILLFIACFAPLDREYAVRRTRGPVPAFAARLLCFQIAILYLGSGLFKLVNPAWRNGEMLEMTMIGPWGSDLARQIVQLGWPSEIWTLLTFGVVVFEVLAGFLIYLPRVRVPVMALAAGFHISVWVLLQIPEFMLCITVYPLFLEHRWSERAAA